MNQRSPLLVHLSLLTAALFAASRAWAETPDDGRAATVAGLVRDSETQEPLEGVEIVLTTGRGEARVRSDARGRYEARLARGLLTCEVTDATSGYMAPWRGFRAPIEVASADGPQTLPPIDLEAGRNVQGVVVDENDQPVVGATVQAVWRASSRWHETSAAGPRQAATASDAKGEFRLSVVRPSGQPAMFADAEGPWFMASTDEAATARPEPIGPDTKEPVRLRLDPGGAVAIAGRAVDSTGRPVAGAAVEVWVQWRSRGVAYFSSPIASGGHDELRTDDEGRFRTVRRFSREAEYAFHVRAGGFMPGASPYASASDEASLTLPDVSMARLRAIRGRVVDRQRRPVAGVRVFQSGDGPARTEAMTGPDGRFAVEDVVDGHVFLFAAKSGYRFQGQLVGPGRQDAELSICRADEPPQPLPPRPKAMPREEELEVASRAYRHLLDQGFADRD
ncbi:MAG TPA: carboxypeptidase-like regulatory domain-containing protein, partial [Pirellulales bacterium]|nr:carboxypeptidase-like regulatory domain-containing protein [Pirellulales bacterium]